MLQSDAGDTQQLPQIIIDAAYYNQLLDLAYGAMLRAPNVAGCLLEEVDRAEVVPSDKVPASVVNMGSEVTYRDNSTGGEETVTLVFPKDADISKRRISVLTPIGAALIGLSEGARFDWTTRDGKLRALTIMKVSAAPMPDAGK